MQPKAKSYIQEQEKQNEGLYLLCMNNIEDSNKNQILVPPWGEILATNRLYDSSRENPI